MPDKGKCKHFLSGAEQCAEFVGCMYKLTDFPYRTNYMYYIYAFFISGILFYFKQLLLHIETKATPPYIDKKMKVAYNWVYKSRVHTKASFLLVWINTEPEKGRQKEVDTKRQRETKKDAIDTKCGR